MTRLTNLTTLNALFTVGTLWQKQGVLYYEGTEVKINTVGGTLVTEDVDPDGITDIFETVYPFTSITVRINGLAQDDTEVTPILNVITGQYMSYQLSAVPDANYTITHTYVRADLKTDTDYIFT